MPPTAEDAQHRDCSDPAVLCMTTCGVELARQEVQKLSMVLVMLNTGTAVIHRMQTEAMTAKGGTRGGAQTARTQVRAGDAAEECGEARGCRVG